MSNGTTRGVSFASTTKFASSAASESSASIVSLNSMSSTKPSNGIHHVEGLEDRPVEEGQSSGEVSRFCKFFQKCCACACCCSGCFTCWGKVREKAREIKDNKFFDYFILTIIFGSSFILVNFVRNLLFFIVFMILVSYARRRAMTYRRCYSRVSSKDLTLAIEW